jgi:hypothetical protein
METAPVDQGGWTTQSGTPERFETEATAATADAIAATELNDTETQGRDSVEATISDGSEGPEADETPTLIDDSAPLLRTIPSSRPIDRLRPPWNRKPDDEPAQES